MLRGGNTLVLMIGVHCLEKNSLRSFAFSPQFRIDSFNYLLTFNANSIKPRFILYFITMFFVILKSLDFLLSKSFNGLVIQGGSRGQTF